MAQGTLLSTLMAYMGKESKEEHLCITQMVHLRLPQHCQSTILQYIFFKSVAARWNLHRQYLDII